jgi:hypothetical protein
MPHTDYEDPETVFPRLEARIHKTTRTQEDSGIVRSCPRRADRPVVAAFVTFGR